MSEKHRIVYRAPGIITQINILKDRYLLLSGDFDRLIVLLINEDDEMYEEIGSVVIGEYIQI